MLSVDFTSHELKALIVIICINILYKCVSAESNDIYSSIYSMETLIETRKSIIDSLERYLNQEEKKMQLLKKEYKRFKTEHEIATKNIASYLGNPISAYLLIKQLTYGLQDIKHILKSGDTFKDYVEEDLVHPQFVELVGAVNAVTRLTETYLLNVNDMADGNIKGLSKATPMSADDCYVIGIVLTNETNDRNCLLWMKEALRKHKENAGFFTEVNIMQQIAYAYYRMGQLDKAVEWFTDIVAVEPDNEIYKYNLKQMEDQLYFPNEKKENHREEDENYMTLKYKSLCRGEGVLYTHLYCRYLTETHAFLKLAPIKMEQIHVNPDITLFHDVISDSEIEELKELSKPSLERAMVYTAHESMVADFRVNKAAWLFENQAPIVTRINRRVGHITGYNSTYGEALQAANYGIGGHYAPHNDFLEIENDRIATVLFYMSDVEGGATVFVNLDVAIQTKKNAAVFWNNLLPNGEGDERMAHGACPVLGGSKWVVTKWILRNGQEFIKPCV